MFYLTIVNKVLCHCHFWLARQYMHYLLMFTYSSANANPLDTDQTASIGAARSGPLLFVEEEKISFQQATERAMTFLWLALKGLTTYN